jgi:hypothetical protein
MSPGLFCLLTIRAASLTQFGQDKGGGAAVPIIHRAPHYFIFTPPCFISFIVAAASSYIVVLDEPAETKV